MTILNIRTVYDHYIKESHLGMLKSASSKGALYEVYCIFGNLIAHSLLLIACVPLLAIRRLPEPLESFPVVGFYQHQWLDELDTIEAPHLRVSFAAARLIDGCLLMATYNPLMQAFRKKINRGRARQSYCDVICDGQCEGHCTEQSEIESS